ncbi:MAG: caspase family protein [Cyanophyceae cyanobacterium]
MCPVALSPAPSSLEEGIAKLWLLLVGVNHYQDASLPSLQYSALDCQGLGEAITEATQVFPQKSVLIHHDFAAHPPKLATVKSSLEQIAAAAQPQDTVLFYFSGHGILEPDSHQAVLCLADTSEQELLKTGLPLHELLQCLGECAARQQLVWLDACHSGGMTLRGARGERTRFDPTSQLVAVLRQRAAQSQGFYALLSCDHHQQSWEFPELGHGVFTYYLMRGLRGEAADAQGVIEADALYQYVYHQTLRYIDTTNQQIRLINQQKSSRGESQLQSEYPLQTPKRIVEGVGQVILGVRSPTDNFQSPRRALVVEGLPSQHTLALSKTLRRAGRFALEYWPRPGREWSEVREAIVDCLGAHRDSSAQCQTTKTMTGETTTVLLYLRGHIEETATGEAWLICGDGTRLSRSWLRQALRRSSISQQIVILDCPEGRALDDWVEDLRLNSEQGQCLMAGATPVAAPEQFAQALLQSLQAAEPQAGLPVAAWIAQLQIELAGTNLSPHIWLSGTQGVIEVLPSSTAKGEVGEIVDLGICPYMGLRAFSEEDTAYFYGRKALTQRLIAEFHHAALAVVGASGSGKSSVVQAGLIAQLRQGKQLPGSEQWWIRAVRPGSKPIAALSRRLVDPGTDKEQAYQQLQIEGLLYQGVEGFVRWLRVRPEPMVVLVVDQFEELFTLSAPPDRQRFLELVLGAVTHAGDRFKLVLCLRADFVAPCLEVPELAAILQHSSVLVPPYLIKEDYRQAIIKPAEQVGLQVEPGLVEVLLSELNHSAGDLPLLQFILEQLWERRQSGQLTLSAYQQLGGLKGALERQAQAVYESLDSEAQACARWIFLALTHLGEGTEDTRRRVPKSELAVTKYPAPLVERTLQNLTAAKLVIVNWEEKAVGQSRSVESESEPPLELSPQVTVEVVHEILIRHWSTLRWWLEENRARLRLQRQLEQSARLWSQSGQQADFLLRGVRLAEAEELYIKYTDELSGAVQQFIEAGLEAQQQEQRQAQQRLRRAQATAVLIGFLGLTSLGLGGLAYRQKVSAQIEKIEALNASSEALLSGQQLESLTASVKAGQQLNSMNGWAQTLLGRSWTQTQLRTASTLQQAIDRTQELNRLERHHQSVNAVSFSPDSQLLASASDDRTVRLWRRDGTLLATLTHGETDASAVDARVTGVAFSPDGRLLAAASTDRTIALWQLDRQDPTKVVLLQTFTGHRDWVTSIHFSPDARLLATTSRDETVKLWSLKGTLIDTLTGHEGWVNSASFSADGQTLASAGEDSTIKLWQLDSEKPASLLKTLEGHRDRITSVAFSPDQHLVSASGDGTVKVWNLAAGTAQVFVGDEEGRPLRAQVNSVRFSPDGQIVVSASADGRLSWWNRDGILMNTLAGHGAEILDVDFSPDSTMLASASADKTVKLWDAAIPLPKQDSGTNSVQFSPANSAFASGDWHGTVKLWHPNDAGTLKSLKGHQSVISEIAFSPKGDVLASASWDRSIKLWRVEDGTLLTTLSGHGDGVTSVALAAANPLDGSLLASGSDDRTIKLWQAVDGQAELLQTLEGHDDGVASVALSPDGRLVASGSYDRTIKLWRLDGTLLKTLNQHGLAIADVKFSPDGETLVSASWDNTLRIWQIAQHQNSVRVRLRQTLSGHQGGVTSIDFSPSGQFLVSSSADTTIKLWDLQTGLLLKTLRGHRAPVKSVSFSSDGQALVSGDEHQGVKLWNLELDALLQRGCERLTYYLRTNPNLAEQERQLCQ